MDASAFSTAMDQSGLKLTDEQKSALFAAYPLFQAMVVRAPPPIPRAAAPPRNITPPGK